MKQKLNYAKKNWSKNLEKYEKQEIEKLLEKVTSSLLKKGALESSIVLLTKESIPLAYLPGAVKLKVKLSGDIIG